MLIFFISTFILTQANELIYPDDFLLHKSVYGSSAIMTSKNKSHIIYYSFSGASIADGLESNMHKVTVHFRSSFPFISSQASKSKSFPKDRYYYGMFKAHNYIYIYGGLDKEQVYNDLWRYDINDDSWKEVVQDSLLFEKFSPRYNFAHTYFTFNESTYFVILGGINQDKAALDDCMIIKVRDDNLLVVENCAKFDLCTGFGLAGGQIRFYDGKIYLFSGVNFENSEYRYFTGLCTLSLGGGNRWVRESIGSGLVESNNGGNVVYLDHLYYFFGSGRNDGEQGYVGNIYKINLLNVTDGWKEVKINSRFEAHSFGYILSNEYIIIFSGLSRGGLLSSSSSISLKTLELKTFDYFSPSKRIGSSLSRISTNLILFGGSSEHYFHNSAWKYNAAHTGRSSKWSKLRGIQTLPEFRKNHAATSQGDYLLIAGGEKPNGDFLNDFWLFDLRYNNWTELIPDRISERPTGFAFACVILKVPYFYILGGISNQRVLMKEVWRYDLTLNTITKMKNLTQNEFPYLFDFGCKYEKSRNWENGKKIIKQNVFVYFGKNDNTGGLDCGIGRLEIKGTDYEYVQMRYENKKMQCRSSAAYYYEKGNVVVVGGKGRFGNGFRDIWVLSVNETHVVKESKSEYELDGIVHSGLYESFNRHLYIISGFSMNGRLSPSSASDLIYKIPLNSILKNSHCDIGFENVNGTCEMCKIGSFSSKIDNQCETCEPIGTLTTTEGATAGIQCLTKRDTISGDFIKHFEQFLGFNSSDISQAPLYQPPDISFFYLIFSTCMLALLIAFILSYKYSKKFYIFLNKKNLLRSRKYKNQKQLSEPMLSRKDSTGLHEVVQKRIEELNERKQIKRKNNIKRIIRNQFKLKETFGGFLTGLLIITIIGFVIYLIIDYITYNQKEKSELIPTATFQKQFTQFYNKLTIDLVSYPFNYGSCSADLIGTKDLKITSLVQQNISFINQANQTSYCCHLKFLVDKEQLYENDHIFINFKRKNIYAKNIFVWVESESSKPGYISQFKQVIKSLPDQSLSGNSPTIFKYLLVPAYFSQENYFLNGFNKSGTVVHTNSAPVLGSLVQDHHLAVGSSLSIKIDLIGSESGMLTSVYFQVGLLKFVSILLTQVVGLFGIYGGIYVMIQMILKKFKNRMNICQSRSVDWTLERK